MEHKTR
ncbi:Putative uncharacterized protein [Escherichia coli D6-117.29]|nr:Putative uncharacterized protein [Escherichia coli D6-117.29]